ncbi:MAG: hypothetical protein HPY66_0945 [Firmicutes bacterium]|nr:hypothetical protein [Bacillota bacterium]MDI6707025.1 hypothetical protein [Bacillota bacterium]
MVTIEEVKDSNGLKRFAEFAWSVYRDDPYWVPPLKGEILSTLEGKDNPLFMNGPHALFIAYKDTEVSGRICVGINETLNNKKNKAEGYVCMFECCSDYNVASALFERAEQWLGDRNIDLVKGPISPTNGDDLRGLLVEGFNGPPVLMNSYNPRYYRDFFERYGFVKYLDLYAYYWDVKDIPEERYLKAVDYAMKRYRFRVDALRLDQFDREMEDIKTVMDTAMPEWDDLTPPTLEEVRAIGRKLRPLADPELIYIARSGGYPIGFSIGLPDYNQVLKHLNGRMFPFGFLKYLWLKNRITGMRVFVLFVIPEFRKKAVSGTMFLKYIQTAKKKGYTYVEGSTIGETNMDMRRDAERAGGKHYRTYRIYSKPVGRCVSF